MQTESKNNVCEFSYYSERGQRLIAGKSLGEVIFLKQRDAGQVSLGSRTVLRQQAEKCQENK